MSVDRTKVLEAAQKQLGKGNYDKAIAELRKIVREDPDDVRTWLKIGDLYTRKGAKSEAISTYSRVATTYGDQGFFLKAVAVYKQILKLDPTRLDIQLGLGEMYEMLHLVSDALATYEHVAASYARSGNIDKALDTLLKMTALDPENIPVRIKAAEALSKAGRTKEAAEEFEEGARLLKEQGRMDDYIKVAERLLYHRPDDLERARELAHIYLERGDPKRALSKLQLCFKADPKDIATLELLAEAFHQLGQLPKTISVYKEVARIHHEANRAEERATTLRRILELDPGDREARQALAQYAGGGSAVRRDIQPPASALIEPTGARRAAPVEEPDLIEEVHMVDEVDEMELLDEEPEDEDEILIVEEEEEDELEQVEVIADDVIDEAVIEDVDELLPDDGHVSADVQREAQIARLLTECDVFLRYGLKQKVIEQLSAVLEIDPMHVEARERLKDLFLESGRIEDAIEQLLTLADVLSEEQSAASVLYLRQVLDIDPNHAEARERLEEVGASVPPPPSRAMTATAEDLAPAMIPGPDDDEVFFLDDEDAGLDMTHPGEAEPPAETLELIDAEPIETLASAPLAPATATDAAPYEDPPPTRDAVPPPASAELPPVGLVVPPPSLQDPLAPMSPEEFEDVPLRPSTPAQAKAEASQRLSMPPGEVEETLDEADFFMAQGLIDEARGMLHDALNTHPNHPLIRDKLREVEFAAQNAANNAAVAKASQEMLVDQSFELAEKLAEEFEEVDDTQAGRDVLDVEQVFAQFKKGVEEQVGAEDTETHFDLGIAYKEMGLLDDAVGEFKLCLTNVSRICIAQTMIGLCHIEKGEIAEAITHFKKGLYAESKTDREELGLYFELGRAYELLHDPKEALYYYQKVQKRDPGFRDVEGRIDALAKPQSPVSVQAPTMAQDDIDAAFDDLMGED
ncbi:MAG: tetratricopeptide repeat protein [Sandaracinaceae bacterium]|nr:tetratricopeptide repeat protein [Sandaracinaceae bacterium]